jgi:hypothetical protein
LHAALLLLLLHGVRCRRWLLVNFDCAAMWLADTTYLKEALSMTPVYLRFTGNVHDYKVARRAVIIV